MILSSAAAETLPGENLKSRISILSKEEYGIHKASAEGSKDVFFCQCGLDLETGTLIEDLDWERVKISKGFFLVKSAKVEPRATRKRKVSVTGSIKAKGSASKSKGVSQVWLLFPRLYSRIVINNYYRTLSRMSKVMMRSLKKMKRQWTTMKTSSMKTRKRTRTN